MKKIISHREWLRWAYTMAGFVFFRFVNPEQNDSDVELYQVAPNQKVSELIKTF